MWTSGSDPVFGTQEVSDESMTKLTSLCANLGAGGNVCPLYWGHKLFTFEE